jgi:predicted RecB family nuclease
MQATEGRTLFSASDLVNFLACEHRTARDLEDLFHPLPRAEDDESNRLVQQKGFEHEAAFLAGLEAKGLRIARIEGKGSAELAAKTREAMQAGFDIIFQAAFFSPPFHGRADFLRRIEEPSDLGAYSYEVLDTKLGRTPRAGFLIQLCLYSDLLGEVQGREPQMMGLVLGDGVEHPFRFADYSRYFRQVRERFLEFTGAQAPSTYPQRCEHCGICPWRDLCDAQWKADDHLNQVAGITRTQIERLRDAGVKTVESLAKLDVATRIPRVPEATLLKLHAQARLQVDARSTGIPEIEVLPLDADGCRGFHRMPEPDAGDVFFDMEGDPYEEGGLEYLFGVWFLEDGSARFRAFWAHDRGEERLAFEAFMDFVRGRLERHPRMHIYHYAHYEPTALKRLMSLHGTREAAVDGLLRAGTFVDLYKVVREAIRTSADGYSIKDLERFYMEAREGEVKDAGASIVYYERWRQTRDADELAKIERYNRDDCRSTQLLRDWLLGHRPQGLAWHAAHAVEGGEPRSTAASAKTEAIEARVAGYRAALVDALPGEEGTWGEEERFRALVYHLVDFHRRADKPQWWALFARQDLSEDELVDDVECLGALRLDESVAPEPVAKSRILAFTFPPQETKLRAGESVCRTDNAEPLGQIVSLDEAAGVARIKVANKREVPAALSIGPSGPINSDALRAAVWRFADAVVAGEDRFPAAAGLLRKAPPQFTSPGSGTPLSRANADIIEATLAAVKALDHSYLFIQGPPGAGKTFTGSHVILRLLLEGKRVGVTSNSHKAINNLLHAVEDRAREKGVRIRGAKKSSKGTDSELAGEMIEDVYDNRDIVEGNHPLVAGTAWLFAEPQLEQSLDYLFVDEAGQVALANLVAMGTAARNIVLLGDQMQLGQPIQGVHPGRSGESTLEYLLDGLATVPADRGIFLPTSWRMHPAVCRFISDAVYDGRLHAEAANARRELVLDASAHAALVPAGIRFLPVRHDGCSQSSEPEAQAVKAIYASLLRQSWRGLDGTARRLTAANILVVAPYNAQVNLLRRTLPEGARVGTIDKFQGQEAEAVIVSMTSSNEECLPRNIEFLYDRNRLNVAVSRAKCLAVVVACPDLLDVHCGTPAQVQLVNTLCWLREYSNEAKHAEHGEDTQTTEKTGFVVESPPVQAPSPECR